MSTFSDAVNSDAIYVVQVYSDWTWKDYINHTTEKAAAEILRTLRLGEKRLRREHQRCFRLIEQKKVVETKTREINVD